VYCWEEGIWGFCIFGMNRDNSGSVGVVESVEWRENVMEEGGSLRPDRKSSRENGRERVSDGGERK
jgi:hypothetical protein